MIRMEQVEKAFDAEVILLVQNAVIHPLTVGIKGVKTVGRS